MKSESIYQRWQSKNLLRIKLRAKESAAIVCMFEDRSLCRLFSGMWCRYSCRFLSYCSHWCVSITLNKNRFLYLTLYIFVYAPRKIFQISSHLHMDGNVHDHAITTLLVAWAQFTGIQTPADQSPVFSETADQSPVLSQKQPTNPRSFLRNSRPIPVLPSEIADQSPFYPQKQTTNPRSFLRNNRPIPGLFSETADQSPILSQKQSNNHQCSQKQPTNPRSFLKNS